MIIDTIYYLTFFLNAIEIIQKNINFHDGYIKEIMKYNGISKEYDSVINIIFGRVKIPLQEDIKNDLVLKTASFLSSKVISK